MPTRWKKKTTRRNALVLMSASPTGKRRIEVRESPFIRANGKPLSCLGYRVDRPFEPLSHVSDAVDDASLRRGPSRRVRAFGCFRPTTASGVDDSNPIELENPRVRQWN